MSEMSRKESKGKCSQQYATALKFTVAVLCVVDHPACERCVIKGLICEYATEGRVRANKPRIQPGLHQEFTAGPSSSRPAVDSPYAVTEPSPSAHHARQQMGGPLRSQSEFRYTGGRDIDDRLGTHPGIPHRFVDLPLHVPYTVIFMIP